MIRRNARFNYLICVYLAGIVVFSLFRIAETVAYCASTEGADNFDGLLGKVLLMGVRFDTVVSCYVLALPLLLVIVGEMARIRKRWYYAVVHYTAMVLYTVCFFACAADIPYFCYFFNRLDVVALSWAEDFGTSMGMILGEPRYWLYLVVFAAVAVGWWLLGRFLYRKFLIGTPLPPLPYKWSISLAAVLLALWFCGQRGTVTGPRPVRISTAYFSDNPLVNQLGLNPVFTFLKSLEEAGKSANQSVSLVDEATVEAVLGEQRAWPADSTLSTARLRLPEGTNVVIVIMESMCADKTALSTLHPPLSLTPCLDSLMRHSLTFTEAYSSGIHTYNGIYSTLYGQPSILARHTMRHTPMPRVCGLPQALGAAGYSTSFFVAHQADFDNLQGFLSLNGMQRVVDKRSYPESEHIGVWGIPDHVLFRHLLEHCDSIAARGPFFASVMTISDHGPYAIPDDIELEFRHKEIDKQVIEYADWSIGRFMDEASRRPWFGNTLFVFVADHGAVMDQRYDLPLSHTHVPLLFYAPGRIAPRMDNRPAMQADIEATVLGLLGIAPPISTLGINLLTYTRPYAYFTADDRIGVVDGEWYYLYRVKQDRGSLYRYREEATEDLIGQQPDRAAAMRRYAFGMIQGSQRMLLDGSTDCLSH